MSVFLISCGGTGGHLAPGISIAQELMQRGHQCHLVISTKQVDARLIAKYPTIQFIKAPGIAFSKKPWKWPLFMYQQIRGMLFAIRILRRIKPDFVIGFGGFITLEIVLAAWLHGYPSLLHEANQIPGKSTRFLSGVCKRLYLPEGVQLRGIPPKTVRHYGFPIRKDILRLSKDESRRRMSMPLNGKLLVVMGGSQGAKVLNDWVVSHFEKLADIGISIYCVTGLKHSHHGSFERNGSAGVSKVTFVPFIDNVGEVLCAADLVIARAGAGSIAEFIHCRLPSILIPYPHATDNHQAANAAFLEKQGGCVVLPQAKLESLDKEVMDLIFNEDLLKKIQGNLECLNRFNSVDLIANDVETLCSEMNSKRARR